MIKINTKRKYRRLMFFILSTGLLSILSVFLIITLRNSASFFYTPSTLNINDVKNKNITIGGLVTNMSINSHRKCQKNCHIITISDKKTKVDVIFDGIIPSLLKINQGVIFKCLVDTEGDIIANKIMIKHDETYLTREEYLKIKEENL